jgi:hypothetical protein
LSREFPIEQVSLADVAELDETHWYEHEGDSPTCRSLLEHMKLIDEVDTSYPIILDQDGRVMDGMHRVCRAVRDGKEQVPAVRFSTTPDPDYVGINPAELPYNE